MSSTKISGNAARIPPGQDHLPVVVFTLEDLQFALPYTFVKRIIQAVYITPIPNSPAEIIGVINIEGQIITVLNIKKIMGLNQNTKNTPLTHNSLTNAYIILQVLNNEFAMVVEDVSFMEYPKQDIVEHKIQNDPFSFIDKMIKTSQGFIQMINPEKIISTYPALFKETIKEREFPNE